MSQPCACHFVNSLRSFTLDCSGSQYVTSPGNKDTCLKLLETIKLRITECSAVLLRGKAPVKWLYFYSRFCLTYSAASNLFLCYSLCSLLLSHVSTPHPLFHVPPPSFSPLSLSLSCALTWTCSHCFSID